MRQQTKIRQEYLLINILTGNCALRVGWFRNVGFAGWHAPSVWEPAEDIYWGSDAEWLALSNTQKHLK